MLGAANKMFTKPRRASAVPDGDGHGGEACLNHPAFHSDAGVPVIALECAFAHIRGRYSEDLVRSWLR